jgi:hypothetical protein
MASGEVFNILDSSYFARGSDVRASVVCCEHGGQRRVIRDASLFRTILYETSALEQTTVREAQAKPLSREFVVVPLAV